MRDVEATCSGVSSGGQQEGEPGTSARSGRDSEASIDLVGQVPEQVKSVYGGGGVRRFGGGADAVVVHHDADHVGLLDDGHVHGGGRGVGDDVAERFPRGAVEGCGDLGGDGRVRGDVQAGPQAVLLDGGEQLEDRGPQTVGLRGGRVDVADQGAELGDRGPGVGRGAIEAGGGVGLPRGRTRSAVPATV